MTSAAAPRMTGADPSRMADADGPRGGRLQRHVYGRACGYGYAQFVTDGHVPTMMPFFALVLADLLKNPYIGSVIAGCFLLAVAVADYVSGADVAFSLFYILVVAYVAWITRYRRVALASAFVAAVIWLVADWFTLGAERPAILAWNAATRLAILVTIGMLISRLRRALDVETSLARTDFLTGVLNVRAFAELAEAEVARAKRFVHPLAVVYVDVDDFKSINDLHGHGHGDEVLRETARALESSLRATDTVARLGGDEFALLLPETAHRDAEHVVDKVRAALSSAMTGRGWDVTFSIGVAAYEKPPDDAGALIKAADAVMYRAKTGGKNRVVFDEAAR